MVPGRYTIIGGVVIVLAAGLAWWWRPEPAQVGARAAISSPTARTPAVEPRPTLPEAPVAPSGDAPSEAATIEMTSDALREATRQGLRIGDRMRARMERDYEIYYEDLGPTLGLTDEENFAIVRTLVEQQIQRYELPPVMDDQIATVEQARELRDAQREDLRALLGPKRLSTFDDYQVSIGAREEVLALTRSAFPNQPISDEQRRRLIREAISAGAYFDEPERPTLDPWHVVQQQTLVKMEQRDAKMIAIARRVLGEAYVAPIQSYQTTRRAAVESTLQPVREE